MKNAISLREEKYIARLSRFYIKDQTQHIIQRGNNRESIFASQQDYEFYLECLADAAKLNKLKIHAYVLMTNHVHLLASPLEESKSNSYDYIRNLTPYFF